MSLAIRPDGYGRPCATPNYAGLDPRQVLAEAISERDLAGARDVAAVIDARIRYRLGTSIPAPAGPWSAQIPALADPERRNYLTEIAALMDARKDRIGEHAAQHALPWAVAALGPVPDDPRDRAGWQQRAAAIGAWRELSGHADPADPIGPEPVAATPDLRAAWHEAFAALGPADGPDVRGMPDGHPDTAARQQELAASCHALHQLYQQRGTTLAATMADRADWDIATRAQRHLAIAADTELRRRHPAQHYPPLRSAEPATATGSQPELTPSADQPPGETGQLTNDLAAAHRTFAERLADRQSLRIPSQEPDYGDLGRAFPPWPSAGSDAILQPPKPEIRPSPYVLERAADRDADYEAGD